jgi:hypothetical protein
MDFANIDYRSLPPAPKENEHQYALRLQNAGFDEMFIRKALRCHFQMKIEDFPTFFEPFLQARLKYVRLLAALRPGQTDTNLARRVARNLGISAESARWLVEEIDRGGERRT